MDVYVFPFTRMGRRPVTLTGLTTTGRRDASFGCLIASDMSLVEFPGAIGQLDG